MQTHMFVNKHHSNHTFLNALTYKFCSKMYSSTVISAKKRQQQNLGYDQKLKANDD